jgi:hypothetical protein
LRFFGNCPYNQGILQTHRPKLEVGKERKVQICHMAGYLVNIFSTKVFENSPPLAYWEKPWARNTTNNRPTKYEKGQRVVVGCTFHTS